MKKILFFLLILTNSSLLFAADGWHLFPNKGNFEPGDYQFLTNITTICQERDTMYFGGWTGGIDIFKPDSVWERLDYRNTTLPKYNDWITGLVINKGNIYAATREGLLIVSDKDTILLDSSNSGMTDPYITHIAKDKSNNIWFTSKSWFELTKYDGNAFHKYTIPNTALVAKTSRACLTVDKNNQVWYLSTRAIVRFDGENFKYWDSTNSPILGSDAVDCLYYNEDMDEIYVAVSKYYAIAEKENPNTRLYKIHDEEWVEVNLENMPLSSKEIAFSSLTMDRITGNIFFLFEVMSESNIGPKNRFLILSPSGDWKLVNIPVNDLIGQEVLPVKSIFIDDQKQILWIGTLQNGVVKADLKTILTSVESEFESVNNNFDISPNPANDFIEISLSKEASPLASGQVQIFNMPGIEVMSVENGLYNSAQRIDISNLPAGVYYVRIGDKVEKIIINH